MIYSHISTRLHVLHSMSSTSMEIYIFNLFFIKKILIFAMVRSLQLFRDVPVADSTMQRRPRDGFRHAFPCP
jgi:hypothetical protein